MCLCVHTHAQFVLKQFLTHVGHRKTLWATHWHSHAGASVQHTYSHAGGKNRSHRHTHTLAFTHNLYSNTHTNHSVFLSLSLSLLSPSLSFLSPFLPLPSHHTNHYVLSGYTILVITSDYSIAKDKASIKCCPPFHHSRQQVAKTHTWGCCISLIINWLKSHGPIEHSYDSVPHVSTASPPKI